MDEPITVDFETEKIESRPKYPPVPVGVAIRHQGGRKEYLAWSHRDYRGRLLADNNCTKQHAKRVLREVWRSGAPLLFHNGAFDTDVANIHMEMPLPANRMEDSLFLAFLNNPHEQTIALKPMGEKYLGMRPEEQEDLRDWILENGRQVSGKKITKKKEWGAYISQAPVDMVGPYAIGDVSRTYRLWKKLRPQIVARGMHEAYVREIKLTPITLEMERSGVRVDLPGLRRAETVFTMFDEKLVKAIHRKLRIKDSHDFNVDSGPQLAAALQRAGKLSSEVRTKTGRLSTKIAVLHETCNDKELLSLLAVHSVASKYISTFIRPWIAQAELTGGRILPRFNQVRSRTADGGGGTRTGRYSSSDPNLQTVTANVDESKNKVVLQLMQKWLLEEYHYRFIGLRDFFLPDEGCILTATDYDQQELRLLAHFEEGMLMQAYLRDAKLDVHEFLRQEINKLTGTLYERKAIKILVFGIIYGIGLEKLGLALGATKQVAAEIKNSLFNVVPGVRKLMMELKIQSTEGYPMRTWGGREYYVEPPFTMSNGQVLEFHYKLLNYRIQGSAADVTKAGMINVSEQVPQARIMMTVHDEVVCSIPNRKYGPKIAAAMCDGKFNVPMTATTKYSEQTWARAK